MHAGLKLCDADNGFCYSRLQCTLASSCVMLTMGLATLGFNARWPQAVMLLHRPDWPHAALQCSSHKLHCTGHIMHRLHHQFAWWWCCLRSWPEHAHLQDVTVCYSTTKPCRHASNAACPATLDITATQQHLHPCWAETCVGINTLFAGW